jgi:hypothetical protein
MDTEILTSEGFNTPEKEFVFRINGPGVYAITRVSIFFKEGSFSRVVFPFKGAYTRFEWMVLAAIEAEICKIEEASGCE